MYNKRGILGNIQDNCKITDVGCWEYKKKLAVDGRPVFVFNGTQFTAHRFVWEICHGAIPNGLGVLHKCHNKVCVNPFHLNLGTTHDNMCDIGINQFEQKEKSLSVLKTEGKLLERTEQETIMKTLEKNKYSKTQTARELGISRKTLWVKLRNSLK